jgi:hypothetical protein
MEGVHFMECLKTNTLECDSCFYGRAQLREEIIDKIAGFLDLYRPTAESLMDEIDHLVEPYISCSRPV